MSAPEPALAASGLPLADTSDMRAIHGVFRTALGHAPALVGGAPDGDTGRASLVADHYAHVFTLLQAHHEGEDLLLTPLLLERLPDSASLVSTIAAQHEPVHDALESARTRLEEWRAEPGPGRRDAATSSLAELQTLLTEHLDAEEREIVPLAATCVDVAEWGQLPGHGVRACAESGCHLWLVLGIVLDEMDPAQSAMLHAHLPPPVAQMWADAGERLFAEHKVALGV